MPTAILHPGPVAVIDTAGTPPSVLAGSPPQWADASDATYSTTTTTNAADGSTSYATAQADIERLAVAPSRVTSIGIRVRASTANTVPTPRRVNIMLWTGVGGTSLVEFGRTAAGGLWTWPDDDLAHDVETTLAQANYDLLGSSMLQVAQALATGALVTARRVPGDTAGEYALTIYELEIVVTYNAASRPHNRIVQRGNDGLGFTGGRRVVQARSIQASNRAVGIR